MKTDSSVIFIGFLETGQFIGNHITFLGSLVFSLFTLFFYWSLCSSGGICGSSKCTSSGGGGGGGGSGTSMTTGSGGPSPVGQTSRMFGSIKEMKDDNSKDK